MSLLLSLLLAAAGDTAAPPRRADSVEGAHGFSLGALVTGSGLEALGFRWARHYWARQRGELEIQIFTGDVPDESREQIIAVVSKRIFTGPDARAAFDRCERARPPIVAKLRRRDRRLKPIRELSRDYGSFVTGFTELSARTGPLPQDGEGHDRNWIRVQCYRPRDAETAELHIAWELGDDARYPPMPPPMPPKSQPVN